MTRDQAVHIDHLLVKIEIYETLLSEVLHCDSLADLSTSESEELKEEFSRAVHKRLDVLLKELEEL